MKDILRIGIIGDLENNRISHKAISETLIHTARESSPGINITWIPTGSLVTREALWELDRFDGLWAAEGNYQNPEGLLLGIRQARLFDKPCLCTGDGFHHMIKEFTSNVAMLNEKEVREYTSRQPNTDSLPAHISIKRNSKTFSAYRRYKVLESGALQYGLDPELLRRLVSSPLKTTGVSDDGIARIIELDNWFFIGTSFLPQSYAESEKTHPLITAFLEAALRLKKLKMKTGEKPETLERRWDILFKNYPEVYDEFAAIEEKDKGEKWINVLRKITELQGKVIADIGSGTGKSTFQLAKYAKAVVGIEVEESMIAIARKNAQQEKLDNVSFKQGRATNIPLEDGTVDCTVSVNGTFLTDSASIEKYVGDAERITKPGGYIVAVGLAPKWGVGGELTPVIVGKTRKEDIDDMYYSTLGSLGFCYKDFSTISNLETVDRAVGIYGFIFGRKAIDYIRKHQKTTIKWKYRMYYKRVNLSSSV